MSGGRFVFPVSLNWYLLGMFRGKNEGVIAESRIRRDTLGTCVRGSEVFSV